MGLIKRKNDRISGDKTGQIGRTIVAERERPESESERMEARRKAKNKKTMNTLISAAVIMVVIVAGVLVGRRLLFGRKDREEVKTETVIYNPTIEILDEGGSNYVPGRLKEYVGKLERDLSELGLTAERAVVPADKTREVDVYLAGRGEFYKCNLDRGTAVTAEDISRMVKYLSERELAPTYVDVRVEGKAYYL